MLLYMAYHLFGLHLYTFSIIASTSGCIITNGIGNSAYDDFLNFDMLLSLPGIIKACLSFMEI